MELLSAVGRWRAKQRKTPPKAGPGKPRSEAPRCPCGQNTLTRAKQRNFGCCKKAGVDVAPITLARSHAIAVLQEAEADRKAAEDW